MSNQNSSGSPMTTMLLMGAVILLFMWLNRPKAPDTQLTDELNSPATVASAADQVSSDTLTLSQISNIINVVRQNGVADTEIAGRFTLRTADASLTVESGSQLSGMVNMPDGRTISIADLMFAARSSITPREACEAINVLMGDIDHVARYQGFAPFTSGDSSTVKLENENLTLELSNKGGIISRASLRNYNRYDSTAVELMAPQLGSYAFTITTATQSFPTSEFYFTPVVESDTSVVMQLDLGSGAVWGLRYTLLPQSYCVKMDIVQKGMQSILPPSTAEMDMRWSSLLQRNEAGKMFEERNSALYYKFAGGGVENLSENKADNEELTEKLRWVAFKNQFFSSILIAPGNFNSAELHSDVLENDPNCLKAMDAVMTFDYNLSAAEPAAFIFYFGPNSYPILSDLQDEIIHDDDLKFTKLIPLGWSLFRWINTLVVIPVFTFLGKFISNYGIIILILTILIKIVLFPFTYKSYMSQAKMRVLTPEINKINEKYPGNENAMKRQQETMALYSRAGANPMSGCLPMLLQMPILIAMFNFFPSAIELRGEPFLWAKDLSAPDAVISWSAHIPFISSTFGNHISLFCMLMTITNIIYTRINMQSQPSGNTMPAMKWMMYLMPLMFLFWFNNYASGLSLYYFLSLLITIIQTYIFRKVVDEDKVRARMRENARKPKKKSGFMARLEEAQRRQQAMLREQEKQRQKGRR